MPREVTVGTVAALTVTVLDSDGTLGTPVALTLTITDPSGNTETHLIADLTVVSVGHYEYLLTIDQAGVWTYRYVASGGFSFDETEYLIATATGGSDRSGPCDDWIGPDDVFAISPASEIADADRDWVLAAATAEAASRILYVLSDRRYPGICADTVRPCRRSIGWATPAAWGATWQVSWGMCGCGAPTIRACGCAGRNEVRLGGSPVLGIVEVLVDGTALASSAYRVDDAGWLVRIDGDPWPSTQDLDLATTEADTWSVRYFYGRQPTADGILAAQRLAGELYLARVGGTCKLPSRVSSLVRQGMELTFLDPQEFLDAGRTGLYEVDLFLSAERYGRTHRATVVASPDRLPGVRRTG